MYICKDLEHIGCSRDCILSDYISTRLSAVRFMRKGAVIIQLTTARLGHGDSVNSVNICVLRLSRFTQSPLQVCCVCSP